MPFKTKKKRAAYMRRYREQQKKKIEQLQKQFPDVFQVVFGKKLKGKKLK